MARKSRRRMKRRKSRKSRRRKRGGSLGDGVFDHESLAMTPEQVAAVTAETHYGRTCKIHPKKGDRYAIYEADGSLSPGYGGEKEDVFKFKHFPSQQHALAKCNKAIKSDKLCKHRDKSVDKPWKTTHDYIPADALDKSEKKFKSFRKCYNFVIPYSKGRVAALPEDKRYCYETKDKFGDVVWKDNLVSSPYVRGKVRARATKTSKSQQRCEEKLSSMGKLAGPDYVYNMPKIEKKGGKRKSRKKKRRKKKKTRRRRR